MTQEHHKKLIEVALPLVAINAASRADKNRKTGTIRNLHKWFAPMPLPAVRALIVASLIDDPGEPLARAELHQLIRELVPEDGSLPSTRAIQKARSLIRDTFAGEPPEIVDPFCGGGSTAVEAQRLGLRCFAGDLNPIPVVITRALTTMIQQGLHEGSSADGGMPVTRQRFTDDVLHYAKAVGADARSALRDAYLQDGQPIAWLWARTVPSPDPSMSGASTPLVSNWILSRQPGNRAALEPVVDRDAGAISFRVVSDITSAPPPSTDRCLFTGAPISHAYVRKQAAAGNMGLTLLATVTEDRHFRPGTREESEFALAVERPEGVELQMPDQALGFRVQNYGIRFWDQMFTPRQQLALATFADGVRAVRSRIIDDGRPDWYADAVVTVLGLSVGKLAQANSTQCRWRVRSGPSKAELAFGMATLPMVWDFAETNPFGRSVGDWEQVVRTALRAFEWVDLEAPAAEVKQVDARAAVHERSGIAVFTDPPYFKQIGYAALSDYFYPWLRRALGEIHPDVFGTLLTPKDQELIAEPARHGGSDDEATLYFVEGFSDVFHDIAEAQRPDCPIVVVYAYRQQETTAAGRVATGWDALLQALVDAGCMVTGTWPVHCAGATRERSQDSNAISSYIALVCRARPTEAGITDRRGFLDELRSTLPKQIRDIQEASVAPVDLAQAAIGPGMAIFSRYSKIVEADGTPMSVRSALGLINVSLDEILAEQEGDFDPDTRFAVAWFEQYGNAEGPFGEADVLSRAKNTAVSALEDAGILHSRGGKVRLLGRSELDPEWDPASDRRLTVWEVTQYLVERLESGGETAAADLLRRVGGLGESGRELAYRLYTICERKGWAQDALGYNALVVSWPEIARQVAGTPEAEAQQSLEV